MVASKASCTGGSSGPKNQLLLHLFRSDLNTEFASNAIKTSKYTVLTFLPQNLLEQFRRVSNIYFLIVMIITLVPGASSINPYSAVVPFMFVLLVAAVKDGYEDYKRHKADWEANSITAMVLRGRHFEPVKSKDIRVGDIIKYQHGEEIRADSLVLNSSLPDGLTFIETANLDGETNAKTRRAKPALIDEIGTVDLIIASCLPTDFLAHQRNSTQQLQSDRHESPTPQNGENFDRIYLDELQRRNGMKQSQAAAATPSLTTPPAVPGTGPYAPPSSCHGVRIYTNNPNPNLSVWSGKVEMPNGDSHLVGIDQFLPRGCILRNTEWIICATLYTGNETKIMLNLKPRPQKVSIMESKVNKMNVFLFIVNQAIILLFCGFALGVAGDLIDKGSLDGHHGAWYARFHLEKYQGVNLFFWRYLNLFSQISYIIPLSLYVSLEFVKGIQIAVISKDEKMAVVNPSTGELKYPRPKTSNLNVQLAHVRYIFTDKTGTLTENSMKYVGGFVDGLTHDGVAHQGEIGAKLLEQLHPCYGKEPHGVVQGEGEISSGVEATTPTFVDEKGETIPANLLYYPSFNEEQVQHLPLFRYLLALALCNNVVCFDDEKAHGKKGHHRKSGHHSREHTRTFSGSPPMISPNNERSPSASMRLPHHRIGSSSVIFAGSPSKHHHHRATLSNSQAIHFRTATTASSTHNVSHITHTMSNVGAASTRSQQHICHLTQRGPVRVNPRPKAPKIYEGQSLDEVALVHAARLNGFELIHRSIKRIVVEIYGNPVAYEIIAELEFTPQRKLMSIILKRCAESDALYQRQQMKYSQVSGSPPTTPVGGRHAHSASYDNKVPREEAAELDGDTSLATLRKNKQTTEIPGVVSSPLASAKIPRKPSFQLEFPSLITRKKSEAVVTPPAPPLIQSPGEDVQVRQPQPPPPPPYIMLTKGADNAMFAVVDRTNPNNIALQETFTVVLNDMATTGLRTLVLGYRHMTADEVDQWLPQYQDALCAEDRESALHEAYALVERDIHLIGTTAVEDKLQDGVPETLQFLLRSEIVVWMLTGDKRETAVTIAATSGLMNPTVDTVSHVDVSSMSIETEEGYKAASVSVREQLDEAMRLCRQLPQNVVLIIDGLSLGCILRSDDLSTLFFQVGALCKAAVCCRMTPLQKAEIVKMFQENTRGVALAIGDGANDVSMIQESRIGVGIMGLEGAQAELASDFAIPKFRHLKRLLVVHGRNALYRESQCILYSIYKNVFLSVALMMYCRHNGFTGLPIFDPWLLAMFNVFFLSLPPLLLGIVDKDVDDEMCETHPQLYAPLEREDMFSNIRCFCSWVVDGLVHAFFCYLLMMESIYSDREALHPYHTTPLEQGGFSMFFVMVVMCDLKAIGTIQLTNFLTVGGMALSFAVLVILCGVYSGMTNLGGTTEMNSVPQDVWVGTLFWIYMVFFCIGVMMTWDVCKHYFRRFFWPENNTVIAKLTAARAWRFALLRWAREEAVIAELKEITSRPQTVRSEGSP